MQKILLAVALVAGLVTTIAAQNLRFTPVVKPTQGGSTQVGNFKLDYIIGEPAQKTLRNGNLVFTEGFEQNEKPLAPTAPTSQTVCSDTAVTFVFTGRIAGHGADQVEWAYDSAFTYSAYCSTDSVLKIQVQPNQKDTIWLRSRVSGSKLVSDSITYVVLTVNFKPQPPTPPAPVSVSSDTAYTFHFTNLRPGFGGNQLEWTLDSAFATSWFMTCYDTTIAGKDTSGCTITMIVPADSSALLWVRCIDTVSGCISDSKASVAIVTNVFQRQSITVDTIITICVGNAANIKIDSTYHNRRYDLVTDTGRIAYAYGNDSVLNMSTGNVYTKTLVNILSVDTLTGDTASIGGGILVNTSNLVDSIVYFEGDTLVYIGDTVCYQASANNGMTVVYSIPDSNAQVNSLTGCVYNINDTIFTLRATIYGVGGCGSIIKDLIVHVNDVAPPIAPDSKTVLADTSIAYTVTFDSIKVGLGGNQIEWATNSSFSGSHTINPYGSISISLMPGADTIIWLRSKNKSSGKVSKSVPTTAGVIYPFLSAGLLDKTDWVLDPKMSDEFDWIRALPQQNDPYYVNGQKFSDKWALNYCFEDDCNPDNCSNHNLWGTSSIAYVNYNGFYNNTDPSDEVYFQNGIAHVTANLITPFTANCSDASKFYPFYYNTGEITLKKKYNFTQPKLFEIRAKYPQNEHWHIGFWTTFSPELDIMEEVSPNHYWWDLGPTNRPKGAINQAASNIHDWSIEAAFEYNNPIVTSCTSGCLPGQTVITVADATNIEKDMWVKGTGIDFGYTKVAGVSGNDVTLSNPTTGTITGSLSFANLNVGCFGWSYKMTPCNYIDDWHTFSCIVSSDEIIFFVDGKETWSERRGGTNQPNVNYPYYPAWGSETHLTLGMAIEGDPNNNYAPYDDAVSSYDFQVDYVRSYDLASGITNAYTLQNKDISDVPKTLESLNANGQQTSPNNKLLFISNTYDNTTHPITSNICYTNEPNSKKIYYASLANNMLYNAYPDGANWVEYPLADGNLQVTDVRGGIAVDADRVYYISTSGYLKFFQWMGSQWANYNTQAFIGTLHPGDPPLDGNLQVDQLGRVFYIKQTDGNVYAWCPSSNTQLDQGTEVQITNDGNAVRGLAVHDCGCLLFYEDADADANLIQKSWWNTWRNQGIVSQHAERSTKIDQHSSSIYFIGEGMDIYRYGWYYNDLNPAGPQKLGGTADCNNNTQTIVSIPLQNTLSVAKNGYVYYLGTDNNLWYYYNDRDHGVNTTGNVISPNWYKTALTYPGGKHMGLVDFEPSDLGELYYVGIDYKLYRVDWIDADNPLLCPAWQNYHSTYKTDGSEANTDNPIDLTRNETQGANATLNVLVYPNPSTNEFAVLVTSTEPHDWIEIQVENVDGKIIFTNFTNKDKLVWNASQENAGVYYYIIKTSNGEIASGKMVKM